MDQARAPSRSILSCTFCRLKKLRCDRLRPCNSCVKRGLQCTYVSPTAAPRSAPTRSTKYLQQRIRQLEEPVNVQPESENKSTKFGFESKSQHESPDDAIASSLGRIHVGETGMSYVSGAHWAALQDSIADLKDCLEADYAVNQPSQNFHGPALLTGLCPPSDKDEILELIPPKHITDRLVSRFFNSMEPGVIVLHAPTFQAEYNRFWDNSQDVSLTWLSLLFSIMSLAIFINCRSEGEPADPIPCPEKTADEFRLEAAYCLIRDKYTKPSKYTIEALLLYGQTEYFRSPDAQYEIWVLFGVVMRLAMRVGLHRDGSRYPGISCFEAEMRRRIWALMSQLESLFSFQMGLPRMIHKGLSDTQLPRNLLDDDFHESSTTLPPSRPDTDFTPVSYLIAKGRIADVFGLITDHVNSTLPGSYKYTIQLDQQLNEAYAAAPSNLQFRGVDQSVTELPMIIIGRYNLDILYQKARCVLHRNYLHDERSDPRYANSRRICIDSAIKLLRHHATIDAQVQPGGVLYSGRCYLSSLTTHNFVLAAMILCLELHYISLGSGQVEDKGLYSKDELLSTLQTSRQVWSKYKETSAEALQAWRSITIMLEKLDSPTGTTTSATDSHNFSAENKLGAGTRSQFTSSGTGVESSFDDPIPVDQLGFEHSMASMACVPEDLMMDNSLWGFSNNIDWVQWDATMQNFDTAGNWAGMYGNQ
ncbi:fungal-specific transcription factor domain-containing protein [Aspergillus granulosus]|uniref:Fungal-specific transcription factor domain-containing protein n=1 Tax=Aspergillus granulosus TaxID=176169 RepID=A0ABR4HC99_9EURO